MADVPVPTEPMADLSPAHFAHFEGKGAPGTLAYCTCDAGPRHLVQQVPETKEMRIHFYADVATQAVTVLHISGRE